MTSGIHPTGALVALLLTESMPSHLVDQSRHKINTEIYASWAQYPWHWRGESTSRAFMRVHAGLAFAITRISIAAV